MANKFIILPLVCFCLCFDKCVWSEGGQFTDQDYAKTTLNKIRLKEIMAKQETCVDKKCSVDRQLKVMNYNVLAQDLIELHTGLYENHSKESLLWEHRSRLLMEQITTFLPDVLTLQEVQESHINSFYKQLEKHGYRGIFKRRTGNKTDGCAIYYMSSVMELVDYSTVEYYRPHINSNLLNRPNIAIIAHLRPTSNYPRVLGRELIVANTHLLFNPHRTDVRLAQIQILLAEMHKIFKKIENEQPAVLLMGDLNSWPDSPVIKLLEEGSISSTLLKLPGISNKCTYINKTQNCDDNQENIPYGKDTCNIKEKPEEKYLKGNSEKGTSHNFNFSSVYNWKNKNNHSLATTFQGRWIIVDYMFYSRNMKLISRLKLPTVEECEYEIGFIPNKASPSDHFPLAATFIVD